HQVLRRQGGAQVVACVVTDKLRGFRGGDMFEHHLQGGKVLQGRGQHPLQEFALPVENINLRVGDFAVNQQQHAAVHHRFQHRGDVADVGNAGIRVGGGACRVEFG